MKQKAKKQKAKKQKAKKQKANWKANWKVHGLRRLPFQSKSGRVHVKVLDPGTDGYGVVETMSKYAE